MDTKLPVSLLKCIKNGSIEIKEDGKKSVKLHAKDNKITINLLAISFNIPSKIGILTKLSEARDLAKNLKDQNLTLYITNKKKIVMKLGKEAKPKLSRMITQSSAVEITDLRELRKLDKRLRLK